MTHSEIIQPDVIAPELRVRETVERQQDAVTRYGSFENYEIAMRERESEAAFRSLQLRTVMEHKKAPAIELSDDEKVMRSACGLTGVLCEEDIVSLASQVSGGKLPAFLNPFALSKMPLGAIGLPQMIAEEAGSEGYNNNIRYNRLPRADESGAVIGCQVFDYRDLGWPSSQGTSARHVTVEEHREIFKRLNTAGLAKIGSPEPVVGRGLDKILADDVPQPPWVISGVLRAGGAALIYGGPGIGKSWLTYTLALGLAAGKDFVLKDSVGNPVLSFGEHEGLRVGIIDGEMIEPDFGYRMKALIGGLGLKPREVLSSDLAPIDPKDFVLAVDEQHRLGLGEPSDAHSNAVALKVIEELYANHKEAEAVGFGFAEGGVPFDLKNIEFYTKTNQDPKAQFISLSSPEDREPIIRWAKRKRFDVLIMDNLSTLCGGLEEENSATAIQPINDLIVSCKREGISVILLHHTNKNGETYRGSTNILTVFETSLRLASVAGPKEGARFSVLVEKDRNMGRLPLHKKIMTLQAGAWLVEEDVNGQLDDLVEALRTLEFTTQKELAAYLKIHSSNVTRGIKRAVSQGKLKEGEADKLLQQAKELRDSPELREDAAGILDL